MEIGIDFSYLPLLLNNLHIYNVQISKIFEIQKWKMGFWQNSQNQSCKTGTQFMPTNMII